MSGEIWQKGNRGYNRAYRAYLESRNEEMPPVVFTVDEETEGLRLTKAVSLRVEGMSVHRAKGLVDQGHVFVNERRILTGSTRLYAGDTIEVYLHRDLTKPTLGPEAILRESSEIVVIDKPARLSVYGSHGVTEDTLLPLLEKMLVDLGRWHKGDRLTLVHRLDKDTTGVLLVARNQRIAQIVEEEFRRRTVGKRYLVLAAGTFRQRRFEQRSTVEARRTGSHDKEGHLNKAVTIFSVLETFEGCGLLEAMPETGRTHQIRIHLARMGSPVLGDIRYGPQTIKNPLFREVPRQMLHARSIEFRDPGTGGWIKVEAPVPGDMDDVLKRLRAQHSPSGQTF